MTTFEAYVDGDTAVQVIAQHGRMFRIALINRADSLNVHERRKGS